MSTLRPFRFVWFVPLLAIAVGCGTGPRLASNGEVLADITPAPLAIAVVPVEDRSATRPVEASAEAEAEAAGEKLPFAIPVPEMSSYLVEYLQRFNAASRVFEAATIESAKEGHADVVLRASLMAPPEVVYTGTSGQWGYSGLLWILTWIGGLVVEGSSYDVNLELRCQFLDPDSEEELLTSQQTAPPVDLTFFDRNDAWSGTFFLTMIWPPFLTGDSEEVTSLSASHKAMRQAAANITELVKIRLVDETAEERGDMTVRLPEVAGPAPTGISGTINAPGPVVGLEITVNGTLVAGDADPTAALPEDWIGQEVRFEDHATLEAALVNRLSQLVDEDRRRFRLDWQTVPVEFGPGENIVRVRSRIARADGRGDTWDVSRTLIVTGAGETK